LLWNIAYKYVNPTNSKISTRNEYGKKENKQGNLNAPIWIAPLLDYFVKKINSYWYYIELLYRQQITKHNTTQFQEDWSLQRNPFKCIWVKDANKSIPDSYWNVQNNTFWQCHFIEWKAKPSRVWKRDRRHWHECTTNKDNTLHKNHGQYNRKN